MPITDYNQKPLRQRKSSIPETEWVIIYTSILQRFIRYRLGTPSLLDRGTCDSTRDSLFMARSEKWDGNIVKLPVRSTLLGIAIKHTVISLNHTNVMYHNSLSNVMDAMAH